MGSKVLVAAAAAGFALSLATVGAKADTVQFSIIDGVNDVTFDVAESPTPSISTPDEFVLSNVQVDLTSNGYKSSPLDTLIFQDATGNAEFIGDTDSYFSFDLGNILETGPLFTDSNQDPTFVPGTYSGGGDTVTITDLSTTPLPPTWTMLLGGMIALGWLAYRSRKTTAGYVPAC
jgi:hypothetical protein